MKFVCNDCQIAEHDACRGSSWCDCQHRVPTGEDKKEKS